MEASRADIAVSCVTVERAPGKGLAGQGDSSLFRLLGVREGDRSGRPGRLTDSVFALSGVLLSRSSGMNWPKFFCWWSVGKWKHKKMEYFKTKKKTPRKTKTKNEKCKVQNAKQTTTHMSRHSFASSGSRFHLQLRFLDQPQRRATRRESDSSRCYGILMRSTEGVGAC